MRRKNDAVFRGVLEERLRSNGEAARKSPRGRPVATTADENAEMHRRSSASEGTFAEGEPEGRASVCANG